MFPGAAIRQRIFGAGESHKDLTSPERTQSTAQPAPKTLRELLFANAAESEDNKPDTKLSLCFYSSPELQNVQRFVPSPPLAVAPDIDGYDRLAQLLHASLERKNNKRRYHEYCDTFWGKHAVDWLVGTQVFPDATDARNALRHLLLRRIIVRADHTKPLFNDALERLAPKLALARRLDLESRFASPSRGFRDNHLYRFPAQAFSKLQLNVRIVRARQLKYRSRIHLGSFVFNAKFRDHKIDPYCILEFGHQTAKTDTWSNGSTTSDDPAWESDFSFPVESNVFTSDFQMKDLWVRIFDFHEVLDDMELGFCLVSTQEIIKNCANGKTWVAWHSLKPASLQSPNERTYGEVELVLSITPFTSLHPLWTVHKEARPKDSETTLHNEHLRDDETGLIATTIDRMGGFINAMGDQVTNLVDKAIPADCSPNVDGDVNPKVVAQHFMLQVYRCHIAPNVADMRKDSMVWVEYSISSPSSTTPLKGKSEAKTWPTKDMGKTQVKGLTIDDIKNAQMTSILVKVYAKATGLTVKIGESVVPLSLFLPDLDAVVPGDDLSQVDWKSQAKTEKLILKRTAAFRRNRKRIVGELFVKATVETDDNAETDEVGGSAFQDELETNHGSMIVEEELANVVAMLADNGFTAPDPLPHKILTEKCNECSLEALFWYILSRSSPVLTTFAAKRNFKDLQLGDWKWGGRDRRTSYVEEENELGSERPTLSEFSQSERIHPGAESDILDNSDVAGGGGRTRSVDFVDRRESTLSLNEPPPLVRNESIRHLENNVQTLPVIPSMEKVATELGGDTAPAAAPEGPSTPKETDSSSTPSPSSRSHTESLSGGRMNSESDKDVIKQPVSTPTQRSGLNQPEVKHSGDQGPIAEKSLVKHGQESFNGSTGEDCPSRLVRYKRPPEFPVGELNVKEVWKLKGFGTDRGFWLEIEGTTDEATYGKQMSTIVQIVGTADANNSCTLSISSKVNWFPRPMSAGLVERNAYPATTKSYQQYAAILKAAMKRKKAGAKGETEVFEEEVAQVAETVGASRLRLLIYFLFSLVFAVVIGAGIMLLYKHSWSLDVFGQMHELWFGNIDQ